MLTINHVIGMFVLVVLGHAKLVFNEVNIDCPEKPERCEFIELFNPDCNEAFYWTNLRGTYIVGVEAGHDDVRVRVSKGRRVRDIISLETKPVVRMLLNLTGVRVMPKQTYVTVCSAAYDCEANFGDIEEWANFNPHHPVRHENDAREFLLNGNKYPIVYFLIETEDQAQVRELLLPDSPHTIDSKHIFNTEKMDFVKKNLLDVIIVGRRAPSQGCLWLEGMFNELRPLRTDGLYTSVSYIAREFDHEGFEDYSLNRCKGATTYVLAKPTPGQTNDCSKHPTLLLQPTDTVNQWLATHYDRYKALAMFADGRDPKEEEIWGPDCYGPKNCYNTWFSRLYFVLKPINIAQRRKELIDNATMVNHDLFRFNMADRYGGDDDHCTSPDKKKIRPTICSQDPNVADEVKVKCIVDVIKAQPDLQFYPPLTSCGEAGTDDGELITLSNFDDSDTIEKEIHDTDSLRSGTYSTADTIMSRSGFFNGNTHNLKITKVCKKHSRLLADKFKNYLMAPKTGILVYHKNKQRLLKCALPKLGDVHEHTKANPVPAQRNLFINKQQSEAIFRTTGILIPTGMPTCRNHFAAANVAMVDYVDIQRTAKETENGAYNIRQTSSICYTESSSQGGEPVICRADGQYIPSQERCIPFVENPLQKSRRLLKVFRTENIVPWWTYTDKYSELSERTKQNYIRGYNSASKVLLNVLAGDDWKVFQNDVKDLRKDSWNKGGNTITTILDETNQIYNTLDSPQSRHLVLGLIALNVPYRLLSKHVSGISHYTYTKSRAVVRYYLSQKSPPPTPPRWKTPDRAKVVFFLNYVLDIATPKPWGAKLKKLSCGDKVELPAFMSNIRPKKIITEFKSYAEQTLGEEERKRLLFRSASTYYAMLKLLPLEYRTSATGLDYKTNRGLEGFDTLNSVLCDLRNAAEIDDDMLNQYLFDLNESKRYLRGDFKYHVNDSSTVADHDIRFALSDPADKRLQATSLKNHDNKCQRCELLKIVLEAIRELVINTKIEPPRKKQLMLSDVDSAISAINEMKFHKLRSVHQNSAKTVILQSLQSSQAFITADFAQKMLPSEGREDQRSYFGKKGISWHIFHIMIKNDDDSFSYKIYQHMFAKQVAQDSSLVLACLNDTLQRLFDDFGITEVYLRTDNAGSYHSAKMLAGVAEWNIQSPIRVLRWDFSEPQDGNIHSYSCLDSFLVFDHRITNNHIPYNCFHKRYVRIMILDKKLL